MILILSSVLRFVSQETGIPADVWRFYLASARPEGQDSSFSWNDLAARNNSELLNNLGNFINRALVFCDKYYNGTLPEMNLSKEDDILLVFINRELRGYIQSMEKARLRDGIRHLLSISRHGNGYMQNYQPWVLLKGNEQQQARAATIIGLCCNIACLLANLLFPYMPTTARTIFQQLNTKQTSLQAEYVSLTMFIYIYLMRDFLAVNLTLICCCQAAIKSANLLRFLQNLSRIS